MIKSVLCPLNYLLPAFGVSIKYQEVEQKKYQEVEPKVIKLPWGGSNLQPSNRGHINNGRKRCEGRERGWPLGYSFQISVVH